ncbi:hypothetical protein SPBR_09134 [Sporothrix brasiliensis 5110]|uniref:Uncharacterized protein n=1 Tax=Sporothrix brasiliensis 5110 TaxID=1398154 RepID=A0A0C2ISH9_9PEZI|nr:uncharacterized protein SPBR_09134 [Sporothrix brasiliensis 5110]KIH92001.1 hypothetical protein SPBR_09134 [Sporothrix brasiliensis 5110]
MEYLGYVAANNPPPNYYLRRAAPPPQPPQNPTPTTVTSTTGTFPLSSGQPKTNSSNSSRSRSSHETGPPAFLGVTTFTRHDNQSHPSPVSIQDDQRQDRYRQPQLPPPYQASPIGNRHKELPPTPAPSALIGGLDFDVTLPSPLHTAVTIDGATHLLATPVTSSTVLPLDHSPARSSYPSQAVRTTQSMRKEHLRNTASSHTGEVKSGISNKSSHNTNNNVNNNSNNSRRGNWNNSENTGGNNGRTKSRTKTKTKT